MGAENLNHARRVLLGRLESLQQAGVMQLPKARRTSPTAAAMPTPAAAGGSAGRVESSAPPVVPMAMPAAANVLAQMDRMETPTMPPKSAQKPASAANLFESGAARPREISAAPTLEVLQQEVAGCTRCDILASTRTQTVFGVGNPSARLCFIGEAPGADEDRLGEPFVGRAGQLLTKIIEACRMKREDVYICNVLKCRPPGNRNPEPTEAANCRRFLDRQLELVNPEFICCLGAVAAQNLLGTVQTIGKLRGSVHMLRGIKVVCTYHPAYLLRNPAAKKDTWDDMKMLLREMGLEIP